MEKSEYLKKSIKIRQLAALPAGKLVEQLAQNHPGIESVAPNIAPHVHSTAINAVQFLNSKLPGAGNELIQDKQIEPSVAQTRAWLDLHKVVSDPTSIFEHVNNKTLNRHHIEAMRSVYPDLHGEIVHKIQERLGDMKAKGQSLPYEKRVMLSKLAGAPLDSTMTQQNAAAIIQSAAPKQNPQSASSAPKKASGVELNQINKTNQIYATDSQSRQLSGKH